MRLQAIVAMVALVAGMAGAAEPGNPPPSVVPVFVDYADANPMVFVQAEILAGKMFVLAGVKVAWCNGRRSCQDNPGAIIVSLARPSQAKFSSGALAAALPYEGVHIELLYDRVKAVARWSQPTLLAHVLVHEITHILQGVSRHSPTGVMKAHWNEADYNAMLWRPLPFTADDVALIHLGILNRARASASSPRP